MWCIFSQLLQRKWIMLIALNAISGWGRMFELSSRLLGTTSSEISPYIVRLWKQTMHLRRVFLFVSWLIHSSLRTMWAVLNTTTFCLIGMALVNSPVAKMTIGVTFILRSTLFELLSGGFYILGFSQLRSVLLWLLVLLLPTNCKYISCVY